MYKKVFVIFESEIETKLRDFFSEQTGEIIQDNFLKCGDLRMFGTSRLTKESLDELNKAFGDKIEFKDWLSDDDLVNFGLLRGLDDTHA